MFDGEMASLEAIVKTKTVKAPKPIKVIELDRGGSAIVMEHVDMRGLSKSVVVCFSQMSGCKCS